MGVNKFYNCARAFQLVFKDLRPFWTLCQCVILGKLAAENRFGFEHWVT